MSFPLIHYNSMYTIYCDKIFFIAECMIIYVKEIIKYAGKCIPGRQRQAVFAAEAWY